MSRWPAQRVAALVGFDLDSKRTVFLVGVIVGGLEPREVVAGLPIVRS